MFSFSDRREREKELQKLYRKHKITARQEGGNDGYCYVIRINGRKFVNGLTRAELPYYKQQILKNMI